VVPHREFKQAIGMRLSPSNLVVAALLFLVSAYCSTAGDFIVGADMSDLAFFESKGKVYKDGGVTTDALTILHKYGVTCVRLRLFTSSAAQAAADPYNYINNLDYTVPLAVRVKNAGLQFMLDFHYSDTWASPGQQAKPSAWTNLAFTALVQQMRAYNSNSIAAFSVAGAMPDYVEVGNEITSGMLWPDGRIGGTVGGTNYDNTTQWSQLRQLMNAAIQGIQDGSAGATMPQIIVHIDRGGDWGGTQYFFDKLNQGGGVPFNIIGESYYPFPGWQGTLAQLSNCLNNAANRYLKPVSVMETAFPWNNTHWPTTTTGINGITSSVTGQVQYVVALAPIVKGVSGGFGAGVFWWATEYQQANGVNTASFETTSWFDTGGNVLPAAVEFGQLSAPLNLNIQLNSPSVQLSWPLSGAGLSLMTTTNLSTPVTWSPVTNAAQNTGTVYWATVPLDSSPQRFYRLQSNW
jgi:arabinogalactan endo-1,4-beta-galactosidase